MEDGRELTPGRKGLRFSDIAKEAVACKRKSRIMLKAHSGQYMKDGGDSGSEDDDESSSSSSGHCVEAEHAGQACTPSTPSGWVQHRKASDWRGMMTRLHKADLLTTLPTQGAAKKSFDRALQRLLVESERTPRVQGCPAGVSENAYQSLRSVFSQLSEGSAQLDSEHVTRFLRSGGALGVDSHVVRRVMNDLAAGRLSEPELPQQTPGSISRDEFVRAASFIIDECDAKEDLRELWRLLGPDASEEIGPERLRKGLARFGHEMTEEEAADFYAFELDGDETLDYMQFVDIIVRHCSNGRTRRPRQET